MINPVLLKSFCTLVELGHFTRTAERLHMTQSGVSQHIRKLEDTVGQALLIRQGKQFTLTKAGQALYHKGKKVLQSLEELETSLQLDPEFEGPVNIMSPGSVGLRLYPKLLMLQQQYPKLKIDYRFAPNDTIEACLKESKLDIALMSKLATQETVKVKAVAKEPLLLVTPANNAEAKTRVIPGEESTPNWEQLKQLGFIQHPDSAYQAALLLGANFDEFTHIDDLPKSGFSNQISAILEPVSLGLGFTVLPAFAVEAFAKQETIKSHVLMQPVSETIYLCTSRQQSLPKRVVSLMDKLENWLTV